jgi:hypothetical protein
MTYWPISSPSVFAATKHTNPEQTRVSNDGVEDDEPNSRSQSQAGDETAVRSEGEVKEREQARLQQQRASDQLIEDDIHGDIIAVRVTRSGHMFATLTRSTLTIWQTKACLQFCTIGLLLIHYIAYGCFSLGLALRAISKDIRPQYRHSSPARLPDLCGADNTRLSDYLLPRDRSFFPRIQNPVCKYTWRSFTENQYHLRLQATAPT